MDDADDGLTRVLARWLGAPSTVPIPATSTVPADALPAPLEHLSESKLAERLRTSRPPDVVAVHAPGARLRRALAAHPPPLVVVTGPADLDLGATAHVLGPNARVVVGAGTIVVAALAGEELAGFVRALGDDLALGIAPTPAWWPRVHRSVVDARRRACIQVDLGAVATLPEAPRRRWETLAEAGDDASLWIPAGVAPYPPRDAPPPVWWAACVAGALERRTGPVFPSPRVASLVLRPPRARPAPSPRWAEALFLQAGRALPEMARAPEMDRPDPDAGLDAPSAAFLAQAVRRRRSRADALLADARKAVPMEADVDGDRIDQVLAVAGTELSEHESKVVLRAAGLAVTRQAVATSASAAASYAERIGFPVVLKAASPDLRRKQDIGAVALDLPTASAVRRAYTAILRAVETRAPTARIDGVIVAEMMPPGLDLRIAVRRLDTGAPGIRVDLATGGVLAAPVFDLLPTTESGARLLAHRVLVALEGRTRRADDPAPEVLAPVFACLWRLWNRTGDRILEVELDPVRYVSADARPVVLDAQIRQRAHLEGL
ncbi:MAG: hypothetical protein D6705_14555 [Deltaproteobacteria bacterium]|nr:MAG: hypothetical protein D6705_14555 [Deltaproteobacteria bacterium]